MAKAKRRNEQMQYMFQHILLMQLHVLSTSFVIQDAAPHLKKGSSVVLIALDLFLLFLLNNLQIYCV